MSTVGLDPHTIFAYDTHRNVPWNVLEYQPVRNYEDPQRAITERKVSNGEATYKRPPTKKGFYLDQHVKNVKDIPSPSQYPTGSCFDQTLNIKESRKHQIDPKLRKNSYLQQIQRKAKLFKQPGVGKYHIQPKSTKSAHHKRDESSLRRFFYEDSEFLSTAVPGSACYFPHDDVPNIRQERKTHKDWIKKHGEERERDKKRRLKEPDPGSYVPLAASFISFDKLKLDYAKRVKKFGNQKPSHGFGSSDSKFTYTRSKKGSVQTRPAPCNYNTLIDWKGKGSDTRKDNWIRCLSAGPTRSLYH